MSDGIDRLRLDDALRRAQPTTDGTIYSVIHLPPNAVVAAAGVVAEYGEAFLGIIVDSHEVTLILPAAVWEAVQRRLPDSQISTDWRLITFDAVLEHDLVGFMALVATVLAEAGVSIFAVSAFERDHILVQASQFETAWRTLNQLG